MSGVTSGNQWSDSRFGTRQRGQGSHPPRMYMVVRRQRHKSRPLKVFLVFSIPIIIKLQIRRHLAVCGLQYTCGFAVPVYDTMICQTLRLVAQRTAG